MLISIWYSLEKQIPLYKKRVYQALENLELADGRYGTGLSNFIELQDARSRYLNSQQEYVQTIYNYNIAKAKLEVAMGKERQLEEAENTKEEIENKTEKNSKKSLFKGKNK